MLRKLARKYRDIDLTEMIKLLQSPYHEDRLLALFLIIHRFSRTDETSKVRVYNLYLENTPFINNWDLVDASAGPVVGAFLWNKDREPLYKLAESANIWERRIAIMATFFFIKRNEFTDTLNIVKILLSDDHDLIHKACGWMLREIGKRDMKGEEEFLEKYCSQMPRAMLRYAKEKFPEEKRQYYLRTKS